MAQAGGPQIVVAPGPEPGKPLMQRILDAVERVGNKVPHPAMIFVILIGIVIVLSHVFYMLGLRVTYEVVNTQTHEVETATTAARSLLTVDGIRFMFTGVVQNFMNFNAVGVIIVAMVGVGVAETAGLVNALIRKLVDVAPRKALSYILVFVGILSSIAADAGYLVLIPLAAAAFISVGRHPLAGLAASFAAVAGAFTVNILIVPTDGILTEITNDAIHLVNPSLSIELTANLWFSIASVILMAIVIALITDTIIEPRLGIYEHDAELEVESASEDQSRGLRFALYGLIGVCIFMLLLVLPLHAPLRNPETGAIFINSPLMNSLIVVIALLFLVCGAAYGVGAGTLNSTLDVINAAYQALCLARRPEPARYHGTPNA
ncbi:MAG: AbgT family transporter, partial [Acetobacteraceae bacterium]